MAAKREVRSLVVGVGIVAICLLVAGGASVDKPPKASQVIVGTFDSRAVMLAYGSASRDGRMPHIEVSKPIAFRQGFGKGDVSEYLDHIRDQIPQIAQKTGVDVIVSKWTIEYHDPNVILVDVTEALIQPFEPTEEDLEIIHDVMAAPPVPEKEIREREASGKEI
jgi:hypothetical protein